MVHNMDISSYRVKNTNKTPLDGLIDYPSPPVLFRLLQTMP